MISSTIGRISEFLKSRSWDSDPDLLGSSLIKLIYDSGDCCDYVQIKIDRGPEISVVSGDSVYDFNVYGNCNFRLQKQ